MERSMALLVPEERAEDIRDAIESLLTILRQSDVNPTLRQQDRLWPREYVLPTTPLLPLLLQLLSLSLLPLCLCLFHVVCLFLCWPLN